MPLYMIRPVPKPRMTVGDRRRKGKEPRPAVGRYWAFVTECRLRGVKLPEDGAQVTFGIPMPASWSKKKREHMMGRAHKQKPDLSNLLKALEDAVHTDDSAISSYAGLQKVWSGEPFIHISETWSPGKESKVIEDWILTKTAARLK